ncbi:MAG: N-acetyltransferase [Clostridia bacterium]|nr:N-acetyltransferase [Clostridia bacterium]
MEIRKARKEDVEKIMHIYDVAREFMRSIGNASQWINGYPQRELVEHDIEKGELFVCETDEIHAVFAFILGEDKTYNYIENGKWSSDTPYGAIHRVASDGKIKGVIGEVAAFCGKTVNHLRIDTHKDNKVMRHVLEKNGFRECGIIYIEDGSPRIAFEKI